jgi:hypothetical protein
MKNILEAARHNLDHEIEFKVLHEHFYDNALYHSVCMTNYLLKTPIFVCKEVLNTCCLNVASQGGSLIKLESLHVASLTRNLFRSLSQRFDFPFGSYSLDIRKALRSLDHEIEFKVLHEHFYDNALYHSVCMTNYLLKTPKEKVQKDKQRATTHTYKTKDRVTRPPLTTGGELMCSGRVSSVVLYICFIDRCLYFCPFCLAILLSVLLRFTDSDYISPE